MIVKSIVDEIRHWYEWDREGIESFMQTKTVYAQL